MSGSLAPGLARGSCLYSRMWWCVWVLLLASTSVGAKFTVYWNSPTQDCHKFGIKINASAFGIIQNTGDHFYGNKVNIFYQPGAFPWLNGSDPVNGGIPQNGNLADHIHVFIKELKKKLPLNFSGVAVLDFEKYYPSLKMSPKEYRQASREWVAAAHPDWPPARVESVAQLSFNQTARQFFQVLLWVGRQLRPDALWGFYHYPYCENYGPGVGDCKPQVMEYNNEISWLIKMSQALYPSIYIFKNSGWDPQTRRLNTRGRLLEALRMRRRTGTHMPILPYFWYRYHDDVSLLSPIDVVNTLGFTKVLGLEGAVVWGSHNDVSSREKCLALQSYVDEQLGPLVQYLDQVPRSVLKTMIASRRLLKKLTIKALKRTKKLHSGLTRPLQ